MKSILLLIDKLGKLISETNLPKELKVHIYAQSHYLCLTFMSSIAYCLGWKILGPYFRVIYTFPQRLKSSLLQIEPWLRIMTICFLPTISTCNLRDFQMKHNVAFTNGSVLKIDCLCPFKHNERKLITKKIFVLT